MMKSYNKYVSMLFAVLLVSSAWAAEVSDSLKTLNTIGQATTYVYNYPSKNAAGEDVVLNVQCSMSNQEAGTTCKVAV